MDTRKNTAMKQDIIINTTTSETRIALLEEDKLVELYVERPENERMMGSIYRGIVRKVMPGISATFVDIGFSQDAFLHFSDIGSGSELGSSTLGDIEQNDDEDTSRRKRKDSHDLKVGQDILVQVIKEPIGHKGPRVSAQVSLPGRFLVLVPNDSFIGVSRKIPGFKEKRRLKTIAMKLKPQGFGLIVRTLAETRSEDILAADVKRLRQTWQKCEQDIRDLKGPGLLYRDISLASSIIRDLYSPEVSSLVVDSRKLHREILNYVKDVATSLTDRIVLYKERTPIFDKYKIEEEIENSISRKVWMSGGGYIYFDMTEALVAVDVNSGRFSGKKDHEENSLKVNLMAANEICRQFRLRDIGGIIVIDFIDMNEEKNRGKVFEEMRHAMRMDRAKWDLAPISPFGLMEMTRQRVRPALLYTFKEPCSNCNGTGLVSSMETVITTLERWIRRFSTKTHERQLALQINPQVKTYLTGGLYSRLARIMWANKIFITLEADENLKIDEFRAYSPKQKRDVTSDFLVGTQLRKA